MGVAHRSPKLLSSSDLPALCLALDCHHKGSESSTFDYVLQIALLVWQILHMTHTAAFPHLQGAPRVEKKDEETLAHTIIALPYNILSFL